MEKPVKIRQVWGHNLEREFSLIRDVLARFRFASIDTEFPGHVFKPQVEAHLISRLPPAEKYRLMKQNVDALKIIQLGLTLSDSEGRLPDFRTPFRYVWEFNFKDFCLDYDSYNPESIELLKSHGIDFGKNREMGICSYDFARQVFLSGLLGRGGCPMTWVTFHGAYDFGFLVKILSQKPLPTRLIDFMASVRELFGVGVYDIKHMARSCDGLYGGLERVAQTLQVDHVAGQSHQAGSDSLLTLQTFFQLLRSGRLNRGNTGIRTLFQFSSVLFGLEVPIAGRWFPPAGIQGSCSPHTSAPAPIPIPIPIPQRCFPVMFGPGCVRHYVYGPQHLYL